MEEHEVVTWYRLKNELHAKRAVAIRKPRSQELRRRERESIANRRPVPPRPILAGPAQILSPVHLEMIRRVRLVQERDDMNRHANACKAMVEDAKKAVARIGREFAGAMRAGASQDRLDGLFALALKQAQIAQDAADEIPPARARSALLTTLIGKLPKTTRKNRRRRVPPPVAITSGPIEGTIGGSASV
jgi:hypothetical protein